MPHLRRCLTRCRHCRLFFLTDPRNGRRWDLGCWFGCSKAHKRRQSNLRTQAYYREHPDKKRSLNENRYRLAPRLSAPLPAAVGQCDSPSGSSGHIPHQEQPAASDGSSSNADQRQPPQCPPELAEVLPKAQDTVFMEHLRLIVSLIEDRPLTVEEIWQALLHFWRQHHMDRRRQIDHTIAWLNANPP